MCVCVSELVVAFRINLKKDSKLGRSYIPAAEIVCYIQRNPLYPDPLYPSPEGARRFLSTRNDAQKHKPQRLAMNHVHTGGGASEPGGGAKGKVDLLLGGFRVKGKEPLPCAYLLGHF